MSNRPDLPLAGKCALITGGARRIGREIALTLARAGANVAITHLTSAEDAARTCADITKLGVSSAAVRCDLRDAAAIPGAAREAISDLGSLDLLVNNAGAYDTREIDEISAKEWDDMFAVNVRAVFFMTQACTPALRASKGRVINIGSLGGIRPWTTHAHYCASKAALHMLTEVSAKSLAPQIKVNCVAPGLIDQGESERGSDTLERFAAKTPMKKNGSAVDVAQAVLFFATCPDFITGQILAVDGGLTLA
ncbi:MAG TPA: SDR family oxidoreductase [Terriglobales bacterium]|nr:SDR family oxidoreductase [Terriglobales bacterium]